MSVTVYLPYKLHKGFILNGIDIDPEFEEGMLGFLPVFRDKESLFEHCGEEVRYCMMTIDDKD